MGRSSEAAFSPDKYRYRPSANRTMRSVFDGSLSAANASLKAASGLPDASTASGGSSGSPNDVPIYVPSTSSTSLPLTGSVSLSATITRSANPTSAQTTAAPSACAGKQSIVIGAVWVVNLDDSPHKWISVSRELGASAILSAVPGGVRRHSGVVGSECRLYDYLLEVRLSMYEALQPKYLLPTHLLPGQTDASILQSYRRPDHPHPKFFNCGCTGLHGITCTGALRRVTQAFALHHRHSKCFASAFTSVSLISIFRYGGALSLKM